MFRNFHRLQNSNRSQVASCDGHMAAAMTTSVLRFDRSVGDVEIAAKWVGSFVLRAMIIMPRRIVAVGVPCPTSSMEPM